MSFAEAPAKFVSAKRQIAYRGSGSGSGSGKTAIAFTLRPSAPRPGELARFYLQVGLPTAGGMGPSSKSSWTLAEGRVYFYRLDRSQSPRPQIFRLQPTAEKGTYGFSRLIESEGTYRAYFVARYRNGKRVQVGFDCVTAGARPKDAHDHDAAPEAKEKAAKPPSKVPRKLSMKDQHQTMRQMGVQWLAVGEQLFGQGAPDWKIVQQRLETFQAWQRNLSRFQLHKFRDQKKEYRKYAAELGKETRGLVRATGQSSLGQARAIYLKIDGGTCVKCHLKFRWAAVKDVSRFPDLRRGRGDDK